MKILFITTALNYGGAYKMLSWVVNQLNQENDVTVIKLIDGAVTRKLDDGVKFIDWEIKWDVNHLEKMSIFLKTEIRLLKWIKTNKPDYVFGFGDVFSMTLLPFKLLAPSVYIQSERGDPNVFFRGAKVRKSLFSLSDYIVFQTSGAQKCFNERIKKKSVVIPNPVLHNVVERTSLKRRDEIAFVGRCEIKQKRQDLMLQAFAKVHEIHPFHRLVFYGDGEDLNRCKEIAEKLGIMDFVDFKGYVSNVLESIVDATMFVLTSDYEGIPNSLIEAMSIGLPVVATDCRPGGAKMLIDNYRNGIIVPIGDMDAVANGICYLIDNPDKADIMGENAKKINEDYSPQKISNEWKQLVRKN